MDCNKEEAIRAKVLAEKKIENKDFLSARKLALKAQHLYPDLESISQMILVCDVLCSADISVCGNEKDWYAILKIEQTADEATIKKQYHKFALSLHPDKNKLTGASDAFKLISEARKVLLDRQTRMLYDIKLKAAGRSQVNMWAKQKTNIKSDARRQPPYQSNFKYNVASENTNQRYPRHPHQSVKNQPTFWTVCPFCFIRYQYFKDILQKTVTCQKCKAHFTAYEINRPGLTSSTNFSRDGLSQQREATRSKEDLQSHSVNSNSAVAFQSDSGDEKHSEPKVRFTSTVGEGLKSDNEFWNSRSKEPCNFGESNSEDNKKKKIVVESGERSESEHNLESEDMRCPQNVNNLVQRSSEFNSELYPEKESRERKRVSCDANLSEHGQSLNPPKRAKYCGAYFGTVEEVVLHGFKKPASLYVNEKGVEVKGLQSYSCEEKPQDGGKDAKTADDKLDMCECNMETSFPTMASCSSAGEEFYEYPDPEFCDFDKHRTEEVFAEGQIWAVYDTLGAMPRFYALIRKVVSPGFKVWLTWLEPDPDDEAEIKWIHEGLPTSCGKFRCGNSEDTEDRQMFSHLVSFEKGNENGTYKICPRKGETWALFKDWDINWSSHQETKRNYAYEYVEVLSDYADGNGVHVAVLSKVEGFSFLFSRKMNEGSSVLIPAKERFRFSHRVPSIRLTGNEKKGLPVGSIELDPASLPINKDRISASEDLKLEAGKDYNNIPYSTFEGDVEDEKAKSERNVSRADAGFKETKAKSNMNASRDDMDEQNCNANENSSLAANTLRPERQSEGDSILGAQDGKGNRNSSPNIPENLVTDHVVSSGFTQGSYDIPEPEFYNFEQDKSPDKFQEGQIWAIYANEDTLPKYYGKIKRIDPHPEFQLHVSWLEACQPAEGVISYVSKEMLICCGNFKVKRGRPQRLTGTDSFSHLLRAERTDSKEVYAIFPRKGEIWALYRNWHPGMQLRDLNGCKYEIVEVLGENNLSVIASVLEPVDNYRFIFRPQMRGKSVVVLRISRTELLRFSHQVPAFRLAEDKFGSLQDFWELDGAALPKYLHG